MQSSSASHRVLFSRVNLIFIFAVTNHADCDKGSLCDGDVGKTLHCLVKSGLLLIIDHLNASIKHLGISLNLFHNVQQPSSNFIISLHVVHSHVFNILVCWRNNLNYIVEESIAYQRNDAW